MHSKNQIFVATPLVEQYVGLEEIDDGVYDAFFCFYHIGRYHHGKNKLEDVISRVPRQSAPGRCAMEECYRCLERKVSPVSREYLGGRCG